jgi:UDP-N-acetylmuramoylalanine--D-glutamate ligase
MMAASLSPLSANPALWKGRTVVVVGAARSGLAAARRLASYGARVILNDSRAHPVDAVPEEIEAVFGGHPEAIFDSADAVVVSPGVPLSLKVFDRVRARGVLLMGELELAARLVRAPILAVTGTNGKSTTTSLVGEILKEAGMNVVVAGNIGNALCGEIDRAAGARYAVVEVSSFQLEGTLTFKPAVACILNVTPDHLDRYPDFASYAEAKALIFRNQGPEDSAVLNADDPVAAGLAPRVPGRIVWFSRKERKEPGVFIEDGWIVASLGGKVSRVAPTETIRIRGAHNLENALAASAVSLLAGAEPPAVARALARFAGLPHRMETVAVRRGVTYINDSKGTNVGAVARSLEGFDRPVILIAGGLDKGGDFASLRSALSPRSRGRGGARLLILLGKAASKIKDALGDLVETATVGSLEEAVRTAAARAREGETVLLSPACASFDMFRDFEDRGEQFAALVRALEDGPTSVGEDAR